MFVMIFQIEIFILAIICETDYDIDNYHCDFDGKIFIRRHFLII